MIAVAALQRYLGEAAWFPTALLPSQDLRRTGLIRKANNRVGTSDIEIIAD